MHRQRETSGSPTLSSTFDIIERSELGDLDDGNIPANSPQWKGKVYWGDDGDKDESECVQVKFKNSGSEDVKVSWVEYSGGMERIVASPGSKQSRNFSLGKEYTIFFQRDEHHPWAEKCVNSFNC